MKNTKIILKDSLPFPLSETLEIKENKIRQIVVQKPPRILEFEKIYKIKVSNFLGLRVLWIYNKKNTVFSALIHPKKEPLEQFLSIYNEFKGE